MWKKIVVSLAVISLLVGCQVKQSDADKKNDKKQETKKVEKIPVETADLKLGPIESTLKSTTHLEAEESVQILARTTNPVKTLLVEEGDEVEKNQLLIELEDDSQRVNLSKAQNEVQKAKLEFERQESLFKKDLISDQDFSEIKYALLQKELALEDAKRELEYTKVRAPIAGTITARYIKVGDQVNINQHLFDLIEFDSIVALTYLPETQLSFLELGQKARIQTAALGNRVYDGQVKRIAPIVDRKTGTVKVTIGVGNQPGLKPGMYVDVELILRTNPTALLIPKRALTYDADQMFVFKLNEDRTVTRCLVVPKLSDKYFIEPMDGFVAGDIIVVAGQSGLKDGSLVRLPGDPVEEEAKDLEQDEKAED